MRRALPLEVGDEVLVELVRSHDERVVEARLGEHAVGRLAQPGEVAGVEPMAARTGLPGGAQLLEHGHGVRQARGERVVGVHQQDGVWVAGRVGPEGRPARCRSSSPRSGRGCPARGCRTACRPARWRCCRPRRCRPRGCRSGRRRDPGPGAGRTPPGRRSPQASRMRAALVAMRVWKLSVLSTTVSRSWASISGPSTCSTRLVREDDGPLGHRLDGASRLESTAGTRERRPRSVPRPAQIGQVLLGEAQVLDQVEQLLQLRR